MGIWYGVEIITHKGDSDYGKSTDADCPIIHISKEENDTNAERYYGHAYGSDYGYNARECYHFFYCKLERLQKLFATLKFDALT